MLPVLFIGWDIIDGCTKFRNVPMKIFLCSAWSDLLCSCPEHCSRLLPTVKQKRGENIERFDEIDHEGSCGATHIRRAMRHNTCCCSYCFIWMVLVFDFGFPRLCARSRQKNDQIQGIMLGGGGVHLSFSGWDIDL